MFLLETFGALQDNPEERLAVGMFKVLTQPFIIVYFGGLA